MSVMVRIARWSVTAVVMVMFPPGGVNLSELVTRLMTTCCNRSGSPLVGAVRPSMSMVMLRSSTSGLRFDGGVGDVGEVDGHGVES